MSEGNPDRARRQTTLNAMVRLQPPASVAPAAAPAAAQGSPALVDDAPAAATVVPAPPTTATLPAKLPAVRQTGLQQQQGPRKRTAAPVRDDPAWKCVQIAGNTEEHQPTVTCLGCGKTFKAGAARVKDHLFGNGGMAICSMVNADAQFTANRLLVQQKMITAAEGKQRKAAIVAVNAAAGAGSSMMLAGAPETRPPDQPALSFSTVGAADVDRVIAHFFVRSRSSPP